MTDESIEIPPTEPHVEAAPAEEAAVETVVERMSVPWWPFIAYIVTWIAYGAGLVIALRTVGDGIAVTDAAVYPTLLFVGILLAVCGPALTLGVWASAATRSGERGLWLFASVAMRGALVTLAGTMIWWVALVVVDALRSGRVW